MREVKNESFKTGKEICLKHCFNNLTNLKEGYWTLKYSEDIGEIDILF